MALERVSREVLVEPAVLAHQDVPVSNAQQSEGPSRSTPGENPWNQGQAPEDWWGAIKRMHGHVGPWNVLGWRIGQAALREFDVKWGRHDLDIILYVPLKTPYSCMADGLVIGTGNCIGRLDIRLAEVMSIDLIHVAIRRKDGTRRYEKPIFNTETKKYKSNAILRSNRQLSLRGPRLAFACCLVLRQEGAVITSNQ